MSKKSDNAAAESAKAEAADATAASTGIDIASDVPPAHEPMVMMPLAFPAQDGPFKGIGPAGRLRLRLKLVPALMEKLQVGRATAAAYFSELSDAAIVQVLNSVAIAKSFVLPAAIGDGKFLELFFKFITDHWQDILKIFLGLFGL